MPIQALKYTFLEVDFEDIKNTIKDNPYKTAAGVGLAGLTAKHMSHTKKKKQGKEQNKYQDYEEPADDLSIALGSSLKKRESKHDCIT